LLTALVHERRAMKRTEWQRKVREWARIQQNPGSDRPA